MKTYYWECVILYFFFNDTATTEIYTLSLHDALPISCSPAWRLLRLCGPKAGACGRRTLHRIRETGGGTPPPSGTLNHRHKGSLTMAKLGAFTAVVLLAAATALAGAAYAKSGGGGGGHGGG